MKFDDLPIDDRIRILSDKCQAMRRDNANRQKNVNRMLNRLTHVSNAADLNLAVSAMADRETNELRVLIESEVVQWKIAEFHFSETWVRLHRLMMEKNDMRQTNETT